ncbi:MAG: OsmC family protein [Paracoccaceae bacterium]
MVKSGSAIWKGDLKTGKGEISTESGAMRSVPYGFASRFEGNSGTNPEELIGAAHAACFSMALSNLLAEAGIVAERIETTSQITLDKGEGGFSVTKAHLVTRIAAPADEARVLEIAQKAKAGCPVSRLLRAEITMDASVAASAR